MRFLDGTEHKLSYDGIDLTEIQHSDGGRLRIQYNDHQMTVVQSNHGSVELEWDEIPEKRVAVQPPDVMFEKVFPKQSVLSKLIYKDADGNIMKTRRYVYDDIRWPSSPTAIYDEDFITSESEQLYAEFHYDAIGRAVYSSLRNGIDAVSVSYPSKNVRVVTNALGRETEYRFDKVHGVKRLVSMTGAPGPNCQQQNTKFSYHANGRPYLIDRDGVINQYPSYKNGGSTYEAKGTPVERRVDKYYDSYERPTHKYYQNHSEHFSRDDKGRVIRYKIDGRGW